MLRRRDFVKAGGAAGGGRRGAGARRAPTCRTHLWAGYDFGPGPALADRLNQGPFGIEQDEGWYTIEATTPSDAAAAQPGPRASSATRSRRAGPRSPRARAARRSSARWRRMAALPFADVFYIRCDWRDVQSRPGRLDLHPVFALTREAARSSGRRFGFRVQLSNTEHQPQELALPDFLRDAGPARHDPLAQRPRGRARRAALRPPGVPQGLPAS